jgi:thiosulfate/3-mercaptopyruvate sulfurtransferase
MNLPPIIDVHAAAAAIAAGARAVDCRFDVVAPGRDSARGESDWRAAHLPGAVYAHLDRDLADLSVPGRGRHPLPSEAAFSATLSRWGIRPGDAVIAYDDGNGAMAARLWWLLRLAGHRDVAVLDGGIAAWRAARLAEESGEPAPLPSVYPLRFDPAAIAGSDEVAALAADRARLLLDARAAPRFRGEQEPIDPIAGHVPGARNRPLQENLDADGRFKPGTLLRAEFAAVLGARAPRDVVLMCGSGVTACHNLLAMAHAGFDGARVYAGSWSEWITDPSRPVARGD